MTTIQSYRMTSTGPISLIPHVDLVIGSSVTTAICRICGTVYRDPSWPGVMADIDHFLVAHRHEKS